MSSFSWTVKYAMIGTFKTTPKDIEITSESIKLSNIKSNDWTNKQLFQLILPFDEIIVIKYCKLQTMNAIILKPNPLSNVKIQDSLHLGKTSKNGFKLDISSFDIRERYVTVVVNQDLTDTTIRQMNRWFKVIKPNSRLVSVGRSDPMFDWIEKTSEDSYGRNREDIKQSVELKYKPIDVMFGTFDCLSNQIVLSLDSMKLISFKSLLKSDVNTDLIIPLKAIISLSYNTNQSVISLFIQIDDTFNKTSVEQLLSDENNSIENKFNVKSDDKRINTIIIRIEDQFSEILSAYLKKVSNINGLKIDLRYFNNKKTKDLIENTKTKIKSINDSKKVKEMEIQLRELKRKYEELDKTNETDIFCGICLEKRTKLLDNNQKIVTTLCGHVFCKQCLEKALNVRKMCPICNKMFKKEKFIEIHV